MSIRTSKQQLTTMVQKAYPIVPLKSTLQILSNIKITHHEGRFEFSATDLDHSLILSEQVEGSGHFEVAVNAKKLFEIIRELPEGEVAITVDENIFSIDSASGFSCRITGSETGDFPGFPQIQQPKEFDVGIASLADMVNKSSFAVSKDETRACLCGVYWQIEPNRHGMVATDGHRLGSCFIEGELSIAEKASLIVSPKTLLHLVKSLGSDSPEAKIHVGVGEKYVLFSNDHIKLCSKLLEGPYPDYEKVIPQDNPKKAIVDRISLLEASRRVSVLSNQKTNLVKFTFDKGELELMVLNRDIGGEARERMPISYDGEQHNIGFNAHYLSEMLGIIKSKKIRMEMNTQISACLIFPEFESAQERKSEDLFLIMPLRILDEM
jgi:DNA polymerase-3 subunit beta